jgi:hypothetical protein
MELSYLVGWRILSIGWASILKAGHRFSPCTWEAGHRFSHYTWKAGHRFSPCTWEAGHRFSPFTWEAGHRFSHCTWEAGHRFSPCTWEAGHQFSACTWEAGHQFSACTWEAGPEEQDSKYQQERGPGGGVRDGEMKWIHTRPADCIWFGKPIFLKFAMCFLAEDTFGIFHRKF